MYLKEGDILYVNPEGIADGMINKDKEFLIIEGVAISKESLLNKPFVITHTRIDRGNHDICIRWLDGQNWWWGQIGYSEPWTKMFITEKQYLRNNKIEQICQIG